MEHFVKIANSFQSLTIFTKFFILNVWQGSENASGIWKSIFQLLLHQHFQSLRLTKCCFLVHLASWFSLRNIFLRSKAKVHWNKMLFPVNLWCNFLEFRNCLSPHSSMITILQWKHYLFPENVILYNNLCMDCKSQVQINYGKTRKLVWIVTQDNIQVVFWYSGMGYFDVVGSSGGWL